MKFKILYILIFIIITSCDVTDPRDNVNIILNADISEEILAERSLNINKPKTTILSNVILSSSSNSTKIKSFSKINSASALQVSLGTINTSNYVLAINGKIKNNLSEATSLKFYLSTEKNLNNFNLAKLVFETTLEGNETLDNITLIEKNVMEFFQANNNKETILYIEGSSNGSVNLTIQELYFVIPPYVQITNLITPPDQDYNLDEIFTTNLQGIVTNSSTNNVIMKVYLSSNITNGNSLNDNDLIISAIIPGNSNFDLSTLALSDIVKTRIKYLVDNKQNLESNVIFYSNGQFLNLSISQVTLDSNLKVTLDLNN